MDPGGRSLVLAQPSCLLPSSPAPIIPAPRSFVYFLDPAPHTVPPTTPHALTGPQLPVPLQLGAGRVRAPVVAAGQEWVSRSGLDLSVTWMLKKARSWVFTTFLATSMSLLPQREQAMGGGTSGR